MNGTPVKVLLVDDDEDDFVITRDLISQDGWESATNWTGKAIMSDGLAAIQRGEHDICLLDYRLGAHTGLELLRESKSLSARPPMILLTGQGDQEIDLEAMKAGAADFLVKGQITANQLDRAIRYAMEHKRAEETFRRERDLISHIMETSPVGIVVTDYDGKDHICQSLRGGCLAPDPEAIAQHTCSVLDWRVADSEGVPRRNQAAAAAACWKPAAP